MATEPENRTADTTVDRLRLVEEWLEYVCSEEEATKGLGESMAGVSVRSMKPEEQLATRGW